jgi:hypothetical protein
MNATRALAGLLVVACAIHASPAASRCVLPVPDGGDVTPTPANVTGRIARVGPGFVEIRPMTGAAVVRVRYDAATQFYSAFGGDYAPADLAPGQRAWIWYVDCRRRAQGTPTAAYLQLYSRDPADQPTR